jgi:glyoxylase-like metal-dependent hydrolase (beta-lactamase superfamily II)
MVYLVKDEGEAAVIDPYWETNPTLGLEIVKKAIKPNRLTSIIITHAHSDHYGGLPALEQSGVETIAHIGDAWAIEDPMYQFMQYFAYETPTKKRFEARLKEIGGRGSRVHRVVRDGDIIDVGSKKFEVIHVPGHTHGSIYLFERREGALFIGDTPYPSSWIPSWLGLVVDADAYSQSLNRLSKMSPKIVLSGHAEPFDGGGWAKEVGLHIEHWRRCESKVLDVLDESRFTALPVVVDGLVKGLLTSVSVDDVTFRMTEWVTVHSLLRKLCFEGKVEQGHGLVWRLS